MSLIGHIFLLLTGFSIALIGAFYVVPAFGGSYRIVWTPPAAPAPIKRPERKVDKGPQVDVAQETSTEALAPATSTEVAPTPVETVEPQMGELELTGDSELDAMRARVRRAQQAEAAAKIGLEESRAQVKQYREMLEAEQAAAIAAEERQAALAETRRALDAHIKAALDGRAQPQDRVEL